MRPHALGNAEASLRVILSDKFQRRMLIDCLQQLADLLKEEQVRLRE